MGTSRFLVASLLLIVSLAIAACGANKPKSNQIFLMPAPEVYEEGTVDPFVELGPIAEGSHPGILFATDRKPAAPDDKKYDFYTHERGTAVSLGIAKIQLGEGEAITWSEARQISLLKERTDKYPLEVIGVENFGPLARTVSAMDEATVISDEPGRRFADEINRRLARSKSKDVYIYVHGYKVNFENPVLVASEFWHFLGYNGAFVAYSWPTKFSAFAYLADLDSAVNSGRKLRALILHIAENTDVERIHILGYSMGTRTVSRMLADLGMYAYLMDPEEIARRTKLGHVFLVGSDVDRQVMAGYLQDGSLRVPRSLTIYQSSEDGVLGMSKLVFGRDRTGQMVDDIQYGERSHRFFEEHPQLRIIDVTDAEDGTEGSGHSYLRGSPWVSSDMLMTLMYDLDPAERGLVLREDAPVWTFPPDYIARLRAALKSANPALFAGPGGDDAQAAIPTDRVAE